MVCKRCGVEFSPAGRTCPFCGAMQESYSGKRVKRPSEGRRKNPSLLFMALVLAAVALIGLFIAPRLSDDSRRLKLVSDIESAYEAQNGAALEILVSRFLKDYPGSGEEERFVSMVEELTGLRPAGSTPPPEADPEEELSAWLLENGRTHVLTIPLLEMSGPNPRGAFSLEAEFVNRSDRTVTQVTFEVEFYDAAGKPVLSKDSGKSKVAAFVKGGFSPSATRQRGVWLSVFENPNAASIKLLSVKVDYEDGAYYYLEGEAAAALLD